MNRLLWCCLVGLLSTFYVVGTAQAIPPFKNAFEEKYVEPSPSEEFKAAFKKASCFTCHVKGEKKDVHNKFGKELSKLIEGNANERIKEARAAGNLDEVTEVILKELDEAFKKVEKMPSPSGPTYGEMIKSGKLPIDPDTAEPAKDA